MSFAVLKNSAAILLLALAVIGFLAPVARAQQVAVAEIDGYVTDPSGQAIVGAQVKATDLDRGQVRTSVTDPTGRYSFPNLSIGNYQLEVSSPGFKTYVQRGIELEVASNRSIPVALAIGSLTESVEVTANAAQVETKENSIAQVVDQQRLIDLPLNGRNPPDLLRITGFSTSNMNVNGNDLTGSKNIQGSNGSGAYSVAGSAANGVNFLLDGGDNNDAFSNVNLPIPFPDAVQEFNLQANGLPAQYGLHPGGVVNIVTKSGSNAFHGDVFEFLRNGDLNGRPKGTVVSQPKRDTLKRNQFGGTAGGRIVPGAAAVPPNCSWYGGPTMLGTMCWLISWALFTVGTSGARATPMLKRTDGGGIDPYVPPSRTVIILTSATPVTGSASTTRKYRRQTLAAGMVAMRIGCVYATRGEPVGAELAL